MLTLRTLVANASAASIFSAADGMPLKMAETLGR